MAFIFQAHSMSHLFYLIKALLIFSLFIVAVSGQSEPATTSDVLAEAYLAKAGSDGKAGDSATIFTPEDIPIFCVVRLSTPDQQKVRMDLVAVNVAGVKPGSKVISTSYTTGANEDRVNFTGRPHGKWVAGKYRADIFVGDKLETSLVFEVSQPISRPAVVNSFVKKPTPKQRKRTKN